MDKNAHLPSGGRAWAKEIMRDLIDKGVI
jgi:hypothetical protein